MARREEKITASGEKFINYVVNNNNLLSGENGPMPFSDDGNGNLVNKTWVVNATSSEVVSAANSNKKPLNQSNLAQSLIDWFNTYASQYDLDPNILAAQAYVESGYKLWYYSKKDTGSGINQFKMLDVYSVIVNNLGSSGPTITPLQLTKITAGLEQDLAVASYTPDGGTTATQTLAKQNRVLLHQNIIDNPEIMIKAQARYMRYLSDKCNKLASSTLLCYHTKSKYASDTYSKVIDNFKKSNGNDNNNPTVKDGLNYVLKVFGVLGDVQNELQNTAFSGAYKPRGHSFGYNTQKDSFKPIFKFNGVSDLTNYPNGDLVDNLGGFDEFEANTAESAAYGITELDDLSIARDERYKFIYFPSDQYFQTADTNKQQIVLHHTVSGDKGGVGGDIKWWRDKGERVATAFIVSRDGGIYQLFNTNYWAYHLGIKGEFIKEQGTTKSNKYLNQKSIGIEIDSWGGLKQANDGFWYPTLMLDKDRQSKEPRKGAEPVTNVTLYNEETNFPNGFRGFYGFETYTQAQINAVEDLIRSLIYLSTPIDNQLKYGKFPSIDVRFNDDMWDVDYGEDGLTPSSPNGAPNISKNAMNGEPGVWTHVSYREDKSDCHPQRELIKMLKGLVVGAPDLE